MRCSATAGVSPATKSLPSLTKPTTGTFASLKAASSLRVVARNAGTSLETSETVVPGRSSKVTATARSAADAVAPNMANTAASRPGERGGVIDNSASYLAVDHDRLNQPGPSSATANTP